MSIQFLVLTNRRSLKSEKQKLTTELCANCQRMEYIHMNRITRKCNSNTSDNYIVIETNCRHGVRSDRKTRAVHFGGPNGPGLAWSRWIEKYIYRLSVTRTRLEHYCRTQAIVTDNSTDACLLYKLCLLWPISLSKFIDRFWLSETVSGNFDRVPTWLFEAGPQNVAIKPEALTNAVLLDCLRVSAWEAGVDWHHFLRLYRTVVPKPMPCPK